MWVKSVKETKQLTNEKLVYVKDVNCSNVMYVLCTFFFFVLTALVEWRDFEPVAGICYLSQRFPSGGGGIKLRENWLTKVR